jgi:Carboxypeptidase regulatory-like domain
MKLTNPTAQVLPSHVHGFNHHLSRLLFGLLVAMLLSTSAVAQSITGTVSGIVTDSNGAAIPGAAVSLVGQQKADTRSATTNNDGRFNFASVQTKAATP